MAARAVALPFAVARAVAVLAAKAQLGLLELFLGELGLDRAETGFVSAFQRFRYHLTTITHYSPPSLQNLKEAHT